MRLRRSRPTSRVVVCGSGSRSSAARSARSSAWNPRRRATMRFAEGTIWSSACSRTSAAATSTSSQSTIYRPRDNVMLSSCSSGLRAPSRERSSVTSPAARSVCATTRRAARLDRAVLADAIEVAGSRPLVTMDCTPAQIQLPAPRSLRHPILVEAIERAARATRASSRRSGSRRARRSRGLDGGSAPRDKAPSTEGSRRSALDDDRIRDAVPRRRLGDVSTSGSSSAARAR